MSTNAAMTAGDLADLFNDLSQAIDDFRLSDAVQDGADPSTLARLKDEAQALENRAHQFITQDMTSTLARIQPDLQRIVAATDRVKRQTGVLNSVTKAIDIATAGVALGAAIATGNLASIGATTQAFVSSIG